MAFLTEQTAAQYFGPAWAQFPWGWLTLIGIAIWIGYAIYDLTNEKSAIRNLIKSYLLDIVEIQFTVDHNRSTEKFNSLVLIKITFKKSAENCAIFVQAGKLENYMDGTMSWEWSERSSLFDRKDYNAGEEYSKTISCRTKENAAIVDVCGKEINLHGASGVINFKIIVTTKKRRQEESIIVYYPQPDWPRPTEKHPEQMKHVSG